MSRTYCSIDGCSEYKETVIKATGHTPGEWKTEKEATCTEEGIQIQNCTVCSVKINERSIAATGHTLGSWQIAKEATCTETGLKVQYCTVCNEKVKEEIINATGHSYGEWVIVTPPTINKDGSKTRTCSVCGNIETQIIAAIVHGEADHTFNGRQEVLKEATCTQSGTLRTYCSFDGCDAYEDEVIAAKGHTPGEWVTEKEANCTDDGLKVQYCTVCNEKCGEEIIAALGHDYSDWKVVKEATFHKDGLMKRICEVCQDELTATIPKLSDSHTHDFSGEQTIIRKATCTEKGLAEIKCSNSECEAIKEIEIPATGHAYGEWKIIKAAEVGVEGVKERTCTVCGEKEQEKITALKANDTEQKNAEKATTVKTGDNISIIVWLVVFVTAGIVIFLKKCLFLSMILVIILL